MIKINMADKNMLIINLHFSQKKKKKEINIIFRQVYDN